MRRFMIAPVGGIFWTVLICTTQGMTIARKPQVPNSQPQSQTIFQLRGGFVSDGTVTFEESGFQGPMSNDAGSAFVLGVEFPSRGWIATGIEMDIDQVSFGGMSSDNTLLGVSVTARRTLKPGMTGPILRPGVAFGYGRMDVPFWSGTAAMFLIRGFLEFDLVSSNHIGLSCEFGLMGSPFGKIEGQTGTFSADARPVLRLGVLFR